VHTKEAILAVHTFGDGVVEKYLADLSDADLLVRPVEGQNHIAWQLGHLLSIEGGILDQIKPGSSPAYPDGFAEAHGRDEAATRSDDPSRFLGKDAYLALWRAQRTATRAVLEGLSDAELDAPGPERVRRMAPTVGGTFVLFGTHALMHVGQFVGVRRKLGKPVAI
jgi:DinB superfamily